MQRFTVEEKNKIIQCLNIVDEIISGKFILFDIKASRILQVIASSEALYGLFAKCLVDYDFNKALRLGEEYRNIQGQFKCSEEYSELLAFVFCLILEINNKKINIQTFVNNNFFSPKGYNYSYLNFARSVVLPFKHALMAELGIEECNSSKEIMGEQVEMDNIEQEINNANSSDKILFANLLVALNELHSAVVADKKIRQEIKDEEYIITLGLIEAVKLENMKVLNALIIPLEYVLGKQKSVRAEYQEVKNCMLEIYEAFTRD